MNAERLHIILKSLRSELASTQLVHRLQQLTTHLERQVGEPNRGEHQQQVSKVLTELQHALESAPSNAFSPAWRQILDEIESAHLLGMELARRLRSIFERNVITPSVALAEIQAIKGEVSRLNGGVENTLSGMASLRIGTEQLCPGECEIGLVIPREAISNELRLFAREVATLDRVSKTIEEICGLPSTSPQIRSISSSNLTVAIALAPVAAAAFAKAIQAILTAYKTVLEIRKLHRELDRQQVPTSALTGIKDHADMRMQHTITTVTTEIVEEYWTGEDTPRKHELATQLKLSLNTVANRIDRGFNYEVRVELPPATTTDQVIEQDGQSKYLNTVHTASQQIRFLELDEHGILALPENSDDAALS